MTSIELLDQQIRQACPNAQGISIGRWDDKQTWLVRPEMIPQSEKDAARSIFEAFDYPGFQAQTTTEIERLAGIEAAVEADPTVQALKAMTNTQFDAWWDANVTTVAQAMAVLKRLTRVMIRRVL